MAELNTNEGLDLKGRWYPHRSSNAEQVRLFVADREIQIVTRDNQVIASAVQDDIEFSQRVGNIPRTLTFPGETGIFETEDNDSIDALVEKNGKKIGAIVHKSEAFHPRLIVVLCMIIASVFALYRYALPVMVEVAIYTTPDIVPKLMSEGTVKALDVTIFDESELDEETKTSIRADFKELAQASTLKPETLNLIFRKSPRIGPNAFALPDGTIIMTDELVDLVDNPDAVLGVLGHEIAHVEYKHSLRQFYRNAGVTGLFLLVTGDIGPIVEDVAVQGTVLLQLSYSRDAETQSDRRSIELMHKIGKDPNSIAVFFEILSKELGLEDDEESYFSTHPATPERLEAIKSYAAEIQQN